VTDANNAPFMLSVSGMRGLIPDSLNPATAARFGAAVGSWIHQQIAAGLGRPDRPAGAPHILVGRDSRPSGPMIEAAAVAGLLATGCRVTRMGLTTTPGLGVMIQHLQADAGLEITASHNPHPWNGIKPIHFEGCAPSLEHVQPLIEQFHLNQPAWADPLKLTEPSEDRQTSTVHVKRILSQINVDAIRARRPRIVLDSVHGVGGPSTAILLEALGVDVVHLYAEPSGLFPHTPEPTAANLVSLCEQVRKHGADVGFAQDPDADRLAIVDAAGRYIGEEYTLVLTSMNLLQRLAHPAGQVLVTNLSTSRMLDDVAARFGASIHRSAVGEANVVAGMKEHAALAGGEGNGGIIWPAIGLIRDSLAGIALVLESLALTGQSVADMVASIPAYALVRDKVPFEASLASQLPQRMKARFAGQKLDLQDGVRVDWPDRWVHVRPSNTEPIVRIIAEASTEADAHQLTQQVRDALAGD